MAKGDCNGNSFYLLIFHFLPFGLIFAWHFRALCPARQTDGIPMPTRRHIFCRSPLHAVIVLLLLAGLGGTLPAYAAPAAASADSPTESPGWFANQLSRFKSYPHLDMAYRRIREGKPEEALTEFEQTLQYAPQNRKARADYMNLLFSLKRYQPAEAQAKRLLTETPDDPEALLTLGLCQLRLGTPQTALANLQRALPLFAKDPKRHRLALLSTVEALAGSGRLQEARTLLDSSQGCPDQSPGPRPRHA